MYILYSPSLLKENVLLQTEDHYNEIPLKGLFSALMAKVKTA